MILIVGIISSKIILLYSEFYVYCVMQLINTVTVGLTASCIGLYELQPPCCFLSLAEDNISWDRVREYNRWCGKLVAGL